MFLSPDLTFSLCSIYAVLYLDPFLTWTVICCTGVVFVCLSLMLVP